MDIRFVTAPTIQDREALEEFADVLTDRAPQIEHDVAHLKQSPDNAEITADLFRAIHNIKGDAALCKYDLAVALAHPVESLMARFRSGEIPFSDPLAELILFTIDRLELATDALLGLKSLDHLQLLPLIQGLERLSTAASTEIDHGSTDLIEKVAGFRPVIGDLCGPQSCNESPPPDPKDATLDLHFFRSLSLQLESRSPLFKGRTMRVLRLALETNKAGGNKVDPVQLEAAVYLHDIGMMYLPESLWLKVGHMTPDDKKTMRNHPAFSAGLLQRMPGWEEAAQIIAQHHEMPDGAGYPSQISGGNICPGAKILAIVDAFEAVMLKHIHRGKNRSVLRAIAEINACDKQFAPEWIAPFNTVIRRTVEN